MPDWRVNHLEGIYKFGAAYPLQKKGTKFYLIMPQVGALRLVHEKTVFVTTLRGQFVTSS